MSLLKRFWRSPAQPQEPVYHPVRAECLVVEDEPEQAALLHGLLRMQGAVVTMANSVASALTCLSGPTQWQVAFVDLMLPGGSGIEIVRLIKERRRGCHVVVVSGSPDKIMLALDYGLISVIMKPYSINAIREVFVMMRLPHPD